MFGAPRLQPFALAKYRGAAQPVLRVGRRGVALRRRGGAGDLEAIAPMIGGRPGLAVEGGERGGCEIGTRRSLTLRSNAQPAATQANAAHKTANRSFAALPRKARQPNAVTVAIAAQASCRPK